LRHGDDSESEEPGEALVSDSEAGQGIRQPDAGPVPPPSPSPETASQIEHLRASLEGRGQGDRGSDQGYSEDSKPALTSPEITEAVRLEVERQWHGPLPRPEVLAQYEQLLPGSAERILVMAEKAATGEIDTADRLASAEIEGARTGQILAFTLTLFAFAAAVVFFALGNRWAGVAFTSVPVVMLIRSFLRRSDSGNL
jgi:uncharacterized membrane protein